jgi:hypothetical protein
MESFTKLTDRRIQYENGQNQNKPAPLVLLLLSCFNGFTKMFFCLMISDKKDGG